MSLLIKKSSWGAGTCAALMIFFAVPTVVTAATYDPLIGMKTANGKLAEKIIRLWLIEGKPAEVFDNYIDRNEYLDHWTDRTADWQQMREYEVRITPATGFPFFVIKQLIAQGDLVVAHLQIVPPGLKQGFGNSMVITMRFKNGKLVETWETEAALKQDADTYFNDRRPSPTGWKCAKGVCDPNSPVMNSSPQSGPPQAVGTR